MLFLCHPWLFAQGARLLPSALDSSRNSFLHTVSPETSDLIAARLSEHSTMAGKSQRICHLNTAIASSWQWKRFTVHWILNLFRQTFPGSRTARKTKGPPHNCVESRIGGKSVNPCSVRTVLEACCLFATKYSSRHPQKFFCSLASRDMEND